MTVEQPALSLAEAYRASLESGYAALRVGDKVCAYAAFERAHVLGQRRTGWHLRSHVGFLRWALRFGDPREFFGQLTRLLAALAFTRIWVPVGNTGGARVSAFRPMDVPPNIAALLKPADERSQTREHAEGDKQ